MECTCFIYFEAPFWVAVFERYDETGYSVCRFVFGAEPNEAELHQFALNDYYRLQFSAPLTYKPEHKENNYKRRQREARRMMENNTHLKQAWQAIKAEQERHKTARKEISREEKAVDELEKYSTRRQQKKEKHRGH